MQRTTRRIAIASQKGGVGKTTLTALLARRLVERGRRVLAVDADPDHPVLLDLHNADPDACPVGSVSAPSGRAAVAYVQKACDLCLAGTAAAMVTAPLN